MLLYIKILIKGDNNEKNHFSLAGIYGKKLVYQVDIYFGDFKPTDANRSVMLNFNSDPNSKVEGTFARFNTDGITVSAGAWENVNYLRRTNINLKDGWHTFHRRRNLR